MIPALNGIHYHPFGTVETYASKVAIVKLLELNLRVCFHLYKIAVFFGGLVVTLKTDKTVYTMEVKDYKNDISQDLLIIKDPY